MFKLFKKNKKEETPKIEKMYEVTYYWITSKGEGGSSEETEIMTEHKFHELASCLYCIIVEAWEL